MCPSAERSIRAEPADFYGRVNNGIRDSRGAALGSSELATNTAVGK